MRQHISQQFTGRAVLGIINTHDPYQSCRDLLSESESIISYDVNKHSCYGTHISVSLMREQYKMTRRFVLLLLDALQL